MNRNKIAGGIKFRELNYNQSSSSQQTAKPVRSKEEVLKLFAKVVDDEKSAQSPNENNAPPEANNQEQSKFESFDGIENICEPVVNKEIIRNIGKTPVKNKLDIVKEKPKVQSNVIDTSEPNIDNVVSSGKRYKTKLTYIS